MIRSTLPTTFQWLCIASILVMLFQACALLFPPPGMAMTTFFTKLSPISCVQSSRVQLRCHLLTLLNCPRLHLEFLLYNSTPCGHTVSHTWLLIHFLCDMTKSCSKAVITNFINDSSADTHKSYIISMNGKMYGKGLDSESELNECSLAK